ncbi:50S ribosomal protein L29 [Candidatus Phytoplasma fraxini]|uniref:Large ribosomal subunit protein uL29 n=1 Tax=Ash yellows phytoplasma TaxID=35780 RepID=A0ABZ2U7N0_ASHYP
MTIEQIRKLSKEEMDKKIFSLKEELFNARMELNLVKLKDTSRIRKIKKIIKQIKTIIREKEIAKINNVDENTKVKNQSVSTLDHENSVAKEDSIQKKDNSLDK